MRRAALVHLLARHWWLYARRVWRENTLLLPLWAGFTYLDVRLLARTPSSGGTAYFAAVALVTTVIALLAPAQLRVGGVLESARFSLLPIPAFTAFRLGLLIGNLTRTLLVSSAVILPTMLSFRVDLTPGARAVLLALLFSWTPAGVIGAELLEHRLRHRASLLTYTAVAAATAALAIGLTYLARTDPTRFVPWVPAAWRDGTSTNLWSTRHHIAGWAVAASAAPTCVGLLALARRATQADRSAPPRQAAPALSGTRPIAAVASGLAPRAPATMAKEFAQSVRVLMFWPNHLWFFAASLAVFSSGNASLFPTAFLLWIAACYNLLGPDVPMGGMTRYALIPQPVTRVLAFRHRAIIAGSALIALAALACAAALGALSRQTEERARPAEYALWFAYGASLFLLFTLAGDRMSIRQPRSIALRSLVARGRGVGTVGGGVAWFASFGLTGIAAIAVMLGWWAALAWRGRLAPPIGSTSGPNSATVLAATFTHSGIYAGYRAITRRRPRRVI